MQENKGPALAFDHVLDQELKARRQLFHLDGPLLLGLLALAIVGLFTLYSASNANVFRLESQVIRLTVSFVVMIGLAQVAPANLFRWTPWMYLAGLVLLFCVLFFGVSSKGAQRWIDLGVMRFQPSELMKVAVPMMVAWYFAEVRLPPTKKQLLIAGGLILLPVILIAKQPDLGTSLLIGSSGFFVIFLAGLSLRLIGILTAAIASFIPILWYFLMHDYQRQRVLTFLNPEADRLGTGYHIIQSKIAIGSGGLYGKGWLNGTQSQLEFLPERDTDFIFSVFCEEFGLAGVIILLSIYLFITIRGLVIASQAQSTYGRLLAGALALTFFVYLFVNIGMVSGLLPVVGVPLPLISYGGTSMVTLLAGFGMIMSIATHKRILVHT